MLLLSCTKEINLGTLCREQTHHALHLLQGINLPLVGSKGCYADAATVCGLGSQLAGWCGLLEWQQTSDGLGIALEARFLLHLMCCVQECLACASVLHDMAHGNACHPEAQAQIFGAEHIMQVAHGVWLQRPQFPVEPLQTAQPLVLCQVDAYELHVLGEPLEYGTYKGTAHHGDVQVGVLARQGFHDGDSHQDVAQGGEAYE